MTDSLWHPDINRADPIIQRSRATSLRSSSAKLSAGQLKDMELQKACNEFESVLISFLLKEMRATVDKSGLIDGGKSEELYQSMMDVELARKLSSAGGLGLAQMLYDQLRSKSGSDARSSGEESGEADGAISQKPLKIR